MAWESGYLSQRGNIRDRNWDKRWHRRFGQAACSSRLGVGAAGLWRPVLRCPKPRGEKGTIQGHRECLVISP